MAASACRAARTRAPTGSTSSGMCQSLPTPGRDRITVRRSGRRSARTVGPAPETTAGTPTRAAVRPGRPCRGIAGARYSWCSRSSVAASSSSGRRSARRPAARPGRRWRRRRRAARLRQQPARPSVVEPLDRDERDRRDTRVGRVSRSPDARAGGPGPRDGQAALQAGGDVVGMTLDLGGQRERVGVGAAPRRRTRARAARMPATIGGRRRSEAAGCGIRLAQRTSSPRLAAPPSSGTPRAAP